jgi:hypothetical protein
MSDRKPEDQMHRKLIRPNLSELKERLGGPRPPRRK